MNQKEYGLNIILSFIFKSDIITHNSSKKNTKNKESKTMKTNIFTGIQQSLLEIEKWLSNCYQDRLPLLITIRTLR